MDGIEISDTLQKEDSKIELLSNEHNNNITTQQSHGIVEKVKKVVIEQKAFLITTFIVAILLLFVGLFAWKDKLDWRAWCTITIVYFTFLALIKGLWTIELIMMCNTSALLLLQIIKPAQALEGFSNPSVLIFS